MRLFGKADLPIKYLFGLAMAGVIFWSFLVPDAPLFQHPAVARIFFWHFPCPMMLTAFLAMGCYFSLRYFVRLKPFFEVESKKRYDWDLRANVALQVGFIFACLTMLSGMLFSLETWGVLWQWDPRQTSFLLALLIYGAYFALRAAFRDQEKRAMNSAAYMLAATLPLMFLIFVYPRLPQVEASSFHPTETIMQGQLKGAYAQVIIVLLIMVSILSTWLYRIGVRVGQLSLATQYGKLEVNRGPAGGGIMVRPVHLSDENRLENKELV